MAVRNGARQRGVEQLEVGMIGKDGTRQPGIAEVPIGGCDPKDQGTRQLAWHWGGVTGQKASNPSIVKELGVALPE
jgi:hypothetical protein